MGEVDGARQFQQDGSSYDRFMGRWSEPLAVSFADAADVHPGQRALDVGCGPGALTGELVRRLGPGNVTAVDPSAPFVADCAARHPGTDVRLGRAESLPVEDAAFDRVLSQLVLHFVSDPETVATELRRVLRPGGIAAACAWDFADGMEMLRAFWDAALEVRGDAPDEARTLRFGGPEEIADLFRSTGFEDVVPHALVVRSTYQDFDELWAGFLAGVGPAGAFCMSLAPDERSAVAAHLHRGIGAPTGSFTLRAVAHGATGRRPSDA